MTHPNPHGSYTTIIIGAGQAGLAAARCLETVEGRHLVLERGRIGESWRNRWDSLRLLTPNWMTGLPGQAPGDADPDGFLTRNDVVRMLERYAAGSDVAIAQGVSVTNVSQSEDGFTVTTDRGVLEATNVVVATGYCDVPSTPVALAARLVDSVNQLHSSDYRSPEELAEGGVLVVGAGSSGIQIAAEIQRSGRAVTLAVGRHARAVRRYRGMDLWWWLDQIGSLDETVDDVHDIDASRHTPSLGLTGAMGGVDIDLGTLRRLGVETVGRVTAVDGTRLSLDDGLAERSATADRRMMRLLDRFDDHATRAGLDAEIGLPVRPMRLRTPDTPDALDLAAAGITTVIWCTGFRRAYPWLDVTVVGSDGEIIQRRGVTPVPGLFVLGLRFQWTRASHFIDRVGADARFVVDEISRRTTAVSCDA